MAYAAAAAATQYDPFTDETVIFMCPFCKSRDSYTVHKGETTTLRCTTCQQCNELGAWKKIDLTLCTCYGCGITGRFSKEGVIPMSPTATSGKSPRLSISPFGSPKSPKPGAAVSPGTSTPDTNPYSVMVRCLQCGELNIVGDSDSLIEEMRKERALQVARERALAVDKCAVFSLCATWRAFCCTGVATAGTSDRVPPKIKYNEPTYYVYDFNQAESGEIVENPSHISAGRAVSVEYYNAILMRTRQLRVLARGDISEDAIVFSKGHPKAGLLAVPDSQLKLGDIVSFGTFISE